MDLEKLLAFNTLTIDMPEEEKIKIANKLQLLKKYLKTSFHNNIVVILL